MRLRRGIVGFIAVVQSVLFLTHFFLYKTWTFAADGSHIGGARWVAPVLGILSVSFVAASLLAFRYTNAPVRLFYRASAVWMGLLSFLLVAAIASWTVLGVASLFTVNLNFHRLVESLFAVAAAAGLYGVFNAGWTR